MIFLQAINSFLNSPQSTVRSKAKLYIDFLHSKKHQTNNKSEQIEYFTEG